MKKGKSLILAVLLMGCLTACASNPMTAVYNDDAKIASQSNTYNLINCEQDIEGQNYKANIEKIEGMDTVWTYEATEDETVELTYFVSVYSGKVKLVLIAPDNSLTVITEMTPETKSEDVQTCMLDLQQGENRIKIVGAENTKVDVDLTIPKGNFCELG